MIPADQLRVETMDRPPGGQHCGQLFGVEVEHLPTGLKAFCDHRSSQKKNRDVCVAMIELGLAELGMETVEEIFADVARMTPEPAKEQDPFESAEYQKFVESMVPHCHCRERDRPCDGVLAGGMCDNIQDDPDDEKTNGYDD